jgi:hypothetical protein
MDTFLFDSLDSFELLRDVSTEPERPSFELEEEPLSLPTVKPLSNLEYRICCNDLLETGCGFASSSSSNLFASASAFRFFTSRKAQALCRCAERALLSRS